MSKRDKYFDTMEDVGELVDAEAILGERYFQEGYRGKALRRKVRWAMVMAQFLCLIPLVDVIPLWELE